MLNSFEVSETGYETFFSSARGWIFFLNGRASTPPTNNNAAHGQNEMFAV